MGRVADDPGNLDRSSGFVLDAVAAHLGLVAVPASAGLAAADGSVGLPCAFLVTSAGAADGFSGSASRTWTTDSIALITPSLFSVTSIRTLPDRSITSVVGYPRKPGIFFSIPSSPIAQR